MSIITIGKCDVNQLETFEREFDRLGLIGGRHVDNDTPQRQILHGK